MEKLAYDTFGVARRRVGAIGQQLLGVVMTRRDVQIPRIFPVHAVDERYEDVIDSLKRQKNGRTKPG